MSLDFLRLNIRQIEGIPFKVYQKPGLFSEEIDFFADNEVRRLKKLLPLFDLAAEMAISENLEFNRCINLCLNFSAIDDPELFKKYRDGLEKLQGSDFSKASSERELITLVMNTRVPQKFFRENREEIESGLGKFEQKSDLFTDETILVWTDAQTYRLPGEVQRQIREFIEIQQLGGNPPKVEEQDPVFFSQESGEESKVPDSKPKRSTRSSKGQE
jgi:hypothetical protein